MRPVTDPKKGKHWRSKKKKKKNTHFQNLANTTRTSYSWKLKSSTQIKKFSLIINVKLISFSKNVSNKKYG